MPLFGDEEPESVSVHDRPLRCVVCQHEAFYRRQAQLPGTVFNVAWMAPVCDCVICSQCGYIHWFYPMKA